MPRDLRPMLATLVEEPFDKDGWIFEVKWDGFRIIAETGARVTLHSRNDKDYTERFAPIARSLKKIRHRAVLDGEVVAMDEKGAVSFQKLHDDSGGTLAYMVFDLLALDGKDVRKLPLLERKKLLKKLLPKLPNVKYSDHVEGRGTELYAVAKQKGLEGIMAKDGASAYASGIRSHAWLKMKTHRRQEVVVVGWTEPRRSRKGIGALVVAVQEKGRLKYAGHVGGGFDAKGLKKAHAKLKPLERASSPLGTEIPTNAPVHWVSPKLVCEVQFAEWTEAGSMRQPVFVGWREDKPASAVVRETPQPDLLPPSKRDKGIVHLAKVWWPGEGITKGDVLAYYKDVAPLILPYLKDRPLSLNRHPDGIEGESFFQKDVAMLHLPPYAKTVDVPSESEGRFITMLKCQDAKTLQYMVGLGCIEINPWNSRARHLEKPDWMIMDLDPEGVPFRAVVDVAREIHDICERLGIPNVCKTSGGRGLHVYVPLGAKYSHEQARGFAELMAAVLEGKFPKLISVERSPKRRKKRVYFDFLQNKFGATNVAPYSLRPRPNAPVATPLKWSEVKDGLDPLDFTIRNARKRFDRAGDLFAPVLGAGIDLEDALRGIEGMG